jgi:hypothetical protein
MIYTWLTIKNVFLKCYDRPNIKNLIDSFTEEENNNTKTVFSMSDIQTNPFAMLAVNIPSFYGGYQTQSWDKDKRYELLPKGRVGVDRLGEQSYRDSKLEIMG